ncbi:MAG: LPS O-antigen length regulator [Gammaproteobacteria bacterium]|nr:MAG: LPS O-antigen length regulator [Gammaproteobacteria bacterium]
MNAQLSTNAYSSDDEIDLRELWNAIWQGKWLIIGITSIFAVASVIYALSLPDEYKSTVLLAPASSSSSSSLSKLGGQFGGLASLAGINLGSGGAEDKSVIAMEIIKTWDFLEAFIVDNNIQVEIFAAEGWDRNSNQLLIDPDLFDMKSNKWVRKFDTGRGEKSEPSSWELFEEIKDRISISQDKTSGLISLSVDYYSPVIAKEWADKLVKSINFHLQKQDREEATKSIAYLNKKIKETNITDMQSVFYQLIEEQTKTLMLAEVSDEYVFRTLSPAKVAEEKAKPKRALIAILGFLLGGMLAVIIVFIRHFRQK